MPDSTASQNMPPTNQLRPVDRHLLLERAAVDAAALLDRGRARTPRPGSTRVTVRRDERHGARPRKAIVEGRAHAGGAGCSASWRGAGARSPARNAGAHDAANARKSQRETRTRRAVACPRAGTGRASTSRSAARGSRSAAGSTCATCALCPAASGQLRPGDDGPALVPTYDIAVRVNGRWRILSIRRRGGPALGTCCRGSGKPQSARCFASATPTMLSSRLSISDPAQMLCARAAAS
jgi:hypothetical protein